MITKIQKDRRTSSFGFLREEKRKEKKRREEERERSPNKRNNSFSLFWIRISKSFEIILMVLVPSARIQFIFFLVILKEERRGKEREGKRKKREKREKKEKKEDLGPILQKVKTAKAKPTRDQVAMANPNHSKISLRV